MRFRVAEVGATDRLDNLSFTIRRYDGSGRPAELAGPEGLAVSPDGHGRNDCRSLR